MFLLYNFLSAIALLFYFPRLLFKKGPEDKVRFLKERLGLSRYGNADIWVHAVSVGEVIACLPFLKLVKKEFSRIKIVFSTTTYTGQKIALERFTEAERIMYMPWDTGICVGRAVRQLMPKVFITVETELWPLLFKKLKDTGSYVVVLNGRLSGESFKGYKRIKPFMKKVLSYVDFFCMQGKDDAERVIALGAEREKVKVMGNFKFDLNIPATDNQGRKTWMNNLNGPILVAGSTHRGEDDIVLDAYQSLRESVSDLKLVLAPRHPERFQEVEEILRKRNLNFVRRTEISQKSENPPAPPLLKGGEGRLFSKGVQEKITELKGQGVEFPDIILLDTIGELSDAYSKAAVAFVGGSLLPYGGHNLLEPAYWAKPVIFGPHMDNFAIASEFLQQDAAIMVKDSADIANAVRDLLRDTEKARQMGQRAKVITENNTGAVKKAVELIKLLLNS